MLSFEWRDLNWRLAAVGATVILGVLIVGLVFGGSGVAATLGYVLTQLAWSGRVTSTVRQLTAFAMLGTALALVGSFASGNVLVSSVLLGVVAYLTVLASGRAKSGATAWTLLSLWTLLALMVGDPEGAGSFAISFAIGSGLAIGVVTVREGGFEPPTNGIDGKLPSLADQVHAAVLGLSVAASLPLGYVFFPDTPYWISLTVLIVGQAGRGNTVQLAVARALGTLVGVVLGVTIVWLLPGGDGWFLGAVATLATLQVLFLKVDYVLYATFLTALVVIVSSADFGDPMSAAWQRLLATLIGALIATGAVVAARRWSPGPDSPQE